jgi:hypothetical protein
MTDCHRCAPCGSDQAVTRARTIVKPRRAIVIDCEATDLPGGTADGVGVTTSGTAREQARFRILVTDNDPVRAFTR